MNIADITNLKDEGLAAISAADSADAVEALRIAYLGSKGKLKEVMKGLKNMDSADRPKAGQAANAFKTELMDAVNARKAAFTEAEGPTSSFDVTLPGQWRGRGGHHPIASITDRCVDIFRSIGFTVASGPNIETVAHNFDALNTPDDHPSRDPEDTYYLPNGDLLRTHTSPVQIRYMKSHQPPVRIIAPGRAYRRDTEDETHTLNFNQLEGLYIGTDVSMADLKGDLTYFAKKILDPGTEVRFRPHFFPFTEPSLEVDFKFEGKWIEIAGAGMVDPAVLRAVGYDPDTVSGYAFGMGIERIAAITSKLRDIRALYRNDVRFLQQFS